MKIYIDNEFKCHLANDGTMSEVETNLFDNKCNTFIEGYRYVPAGETWIRKDGVEFKGEMIAPWRNYNELEKAQLIYEKEQIEKAFNILIEGVEN